MEPPRKTLFQKFVSRWGECKGCDLSKTRNKIVLARGKVPADILFIGEAPGPSEDTLGIPFIGPAGKLLDEWIGMTVEGRYSYCLTNLVCCMPKGEDGHKIEMPDDKMVKACSTRLSEFVMICQPQLIVMVGALATKFLPNMFGCLGKGGRCPMVSIIHPAAILRMDISKQGLAIQRTVVTLEDAISSLGD